MRIVAGGAGDEIPSDMITGGCLCGAVHYQAAGEALYAVLCHCRDCQRSSGTGHIPVMGVAKSSFTVEGETKGYAVRHASGRTSVRYFCPACGSLLYGTAENAPDAISIYIGTLDDPSVFRPDAVMFKRDRHAWDITTAPLTEFDTMPSAPPHRSTK